MFRRFLCYLCRLIQGPCCPWVEGRYEVENNTQSLLFQTGRLKVSCQGLCFSLRVQHRIGKRRALESVIHIGIRDPKKPLLLWTSILKAEPCRKVAGVGLVPWPVWHMSKPKWCWELSLYSGYPGPFKLLYAQGEEVEMLRVLVN